MITSRRVLLDACVLVPISLCDVILSLADRGLFIPQWSAAILDETEHAIARVLSASRGLEDAAAAASGRRSAMEAAFPAAIVFNYEALIPVMTNHQKDRHVLAAAVQAAAATIVTANVKDFPAEATGPFGIEIKTPDDFLTDILGLDPQLVLDTLRILAAQKRRPPMDERVLLQRLAKSVPRFTAASLFHLESEIS